MHSDGVPDLLSSLDACMPCSVWVTCSLLTHLDQDEAADRETPWYVVDIFSLICLDHFRPLLEPSSLDGVVYTRP